MTRGRRPGEPQSPPDSALLAADGVSPELIELAVRLGRARFGLGLTHQQLADRSGVNRAIIVSIERGKRDPYMTTLTRLRRALGVSWADLLPAEDRRRSRLTSMDRIGAPTLVPVRAENRHPRHPPRVVSDQLLHATDSGATPALRV